jgi:hypothetical protein
MTNAEPMVMGPACGPAVSLEALPECWRSLATSFEQFGGSTQAQALQCCANMLEQALHARDEALLTLEEAERVSGYSGDHLRRLVREGKIPNAGRRYAPRIRRRDVPRKACRLQSSPVGSNLAGATPGQIARAVVNSDRGGRR